MIPGDGTQRPLLIPCSIDICHTCTGSGLLFSLPSWVQQLLICATVLHASKFILKSPHKILSAYDKYFSCCTPCFSPLLLLFLINPEGCTLPHSVKVLHRLSMRTTRAKATAYQGVSYSIQIIWVIRVGLEPVFLEWASTLPSTL